MTLIIETFKDEESMTTHISYILGCYDYELREDALK